MGPHIRSIMTTEFNSFDQSELGGFTESPLGARNDVIARDLHFVFIDEAEGSAYGGGYVENIDKARRDLNKWNVFRGEHPKVEFHLGMTGGGAIWNASLPFPTGVTQHPISRSPHIREAEVFADLVTFSANPHASIFLPANPDLNNVNVLILADISPSIGEVLEDWVTNLMEPRFPSNVTLRRWRLGPSELWLGTLLSGWE